MLENEKLINLVRIMLKGVVVACLVLLLVIGYAIVKTTNVMANSSDINNARSAVPNITGTRIDSCSLCHTSAPSLNAFGSAYLANGRSTSAFAAIAAFDSDGDGFTNAEELAALTFPGNAADFPAAPSPTVPPPTPTNTAVPPTLTNTPVPPTATGLPPTGTVVPPTQTPFPTASSTPLPPYPSPTSVISPMPPSAGPTIQPTSTVGCSGYEEDDHCGEYEDDDDCEHSGDDDHCEYDDGDHEGGSGGGDHDDDGDHEGDGHKGGGGDHGGDDDHGGGGDHDGGGDHEGGGGHKGGGG